MLWVAVVVVAIGYFWVGLRYGLTGLKFMGVSVSDAKIIVEALQSVVETMAIVVAGVWAYDRFIKNREDYPYPKIEQRCDHHVLDDNLIYLSVFVIVTNQGKTKLDLNGAKIIVRQVSPLLGEIKKILKDEKQNFDEDKIRSGSVKEIFVDQGQRLRWPTLGDREWKGERGKINELEPGQTREYQFDFLLLEDDVKIIEAISYFNNEKTAWEIGTLYSLDAKTNLTNSNLMY